jgi:SAM-dependent methyltransferase
MKKHPDRQLYVPTKADLYKTIGVAGTTFQMSFDDTAAVMKDLSGKTMLDFGCGTGRSAQFLLSLGAERVVGVDHDREMIEQAEKLNNPLLQFHYINERIPYPDNTFDGGLCTHVLIEFSSRQKMESTLGEVYRVLKPEASFVVVSTNPASINHDYVSFYYKKRQEYLKTGDTVTCVLRTDPPLEFHDTYWEEGDYTSALEQVGFDITELRYPKALTTDGWKAEAEVAPDIVIHAVKKRR